MSKVVSTYGKTDELGFEAVENKVHLHDLHATILNIMGLDHELLTYFHQRRDESLTDVHGRVIVDILARSAQSSGIKELLTD